ncbi:breast cancer type 2 susceptibility protein homolog isoform X3 [Drosophila persimilis]|uniref:breast cancer type 2 susceptibility protein homolog isoform X3 n=1 Tax=Drosophila persimilis TaxID=7234 RepID=UPI000F08373D|nr:breast cancer type 2 susceptibility protein homolog isoform X3 [Drosophila persimilis]
MDLEHMLANPLASDCSPSVQSQRLRRRDKRKLDDDNAATDHQPPENTCIAAELANIYQADRQHSLLALQIPTQNRSVVSSSEFISMHDLLLSQSDYGTPEEKQEARVHITELILRDFCSSPTYEEEENIPIYDSPPWFRFRKKTIKTYSRKPPTRKQQTVAAEEDEEDRLSCSSGLSVQEDHTAVAQVPATTALCELDANSSQKICENLFNLSEYFSVSNTGLNPNNASKSASAQKALSIDLPIKQETPIHRKNLDSNSSVECTSVEFENLEEDLLKHGYTYEASEVCDIKAPPGNETTTLFGESESIRRTSPTNGHSEMDAKACVDWSEGDSFLANYNTEKMSLSNDEPIKSDKSDVKPTKRLANPQQSTYFTLEDIPMSEWQTIMEVPDVSSIKTEASDNQTVKLEEMDKIEAKFLEEIPDWKPEGIALRTASKKPIEVSEENAKKAAKLLSDIQAASDTQFLQEITLRQWPGMDVPEAISEVVGFRTASNKPIEISEEMKKRGAMLLADVEGGETDPPKHTREIGDKECFSEDMGIAVGFRTASNKPIEVSEETKKRGAKVLADVDVETQFLQDITLSQWPGMDVPEAISEVVGFRTASNKPIVISEEMKKRGAMLLADVEGGETDPPKHTREIRDKECFSEDMGIAVGFRTASNKPIEVSEETKKRGARLLADVDVDTQFLQDITLSQWPGMDVPEDISEVVGFRTASNKPIEISEEMKKRGAMLLANVHATEQLNYPSDAQYRKEMDLTELDIPEIVRFRTATSKPIEVAQPMIMKAAELMADVEAESTNEPSLKSPKTFASSEATEVMDALTGDVLPLNCEPECLPEMSDYLSGDDFKGFPSGKCQPMDLFGLLVFPRLSETVEYSSEKAPANDSRSGTPKQRRETSDGIPSSKRRRRNAEPQLSSSLQQTPQNGTQLSKTTSWHSALGSPMNSQSIPASLSQLAERSPLDRITKTSVIGRRNLLSLSKRRKRVSTVGECQVQDTVTPVKPRFAPMSASTSTPLSNRNINLVEEYRGGEDVSPICMRPQKAPRIGLSRSRY